MRILLVEDNVALADGTAEALKREGHAVDVAYDAADGWLLARSEPPDVIVLDLGLPDQDGLELLRRLRRDGRRMPVLILTARDATDDKVAGLDAGADDYLTKPFEQSELFARLRVIERRAASATSAEFSVGALTIDSAARQVRYRGEPLELSRREYALLKTLAESPGRVYTRDQLEQKLYSWDAKVASNAVEVHVHNLRKKLPDDLIRTVRGVGYYLVEP